MPFDLTNIVRPNIRSLKPYSSARSEFAGAADIFLDANENALGSPAGNGYNRYPDPLQRELKAGVAEIRGIGPDQIFVGNGSDEAIDLLFRIFCEPGRDEVIICPPTYGMYRVSADINDIAVREVPLTSEFAVDTPSILAAVREHTKLIFICSPNNPTGNLMSRDSVIEIASAFSGIVVVDEAYIDFAAQSSMTEDLARMPNLVILQTFSKAWGMAGIRVGLAFAAPPIIEWMNRVKPPYNVSGIAQQTVIDALASKPVVDGWIAVTLAERERLASRLSELGPVERVFPSDANFLLVRVTDAAELYRFLLIEKIVVRDRSNVELCGGCLRITVGTPDENTELLDAVGRFEGRRQE